MLADATTTSPSDWRYVSEGGATIVFAYHGPPNPDFDNTVIRLRKVTDSKQQPAQLGKVTEESDDPSIIFQHRCMERLIPPMHLPRLDPVFVSSAWLQELAETHQDERPKGRQDKGGIDLNKRKGVIATDLVGDKGIAVEIKPKWSFLPNTSFLSHNHQVIKSRTCRYCMHNSIKARQGKGIPVKYCPLDLFSPDAARVRQAIKSLYEAWRDSDGTVNNLKVFVGGHKIRVSDRNLMQADPSQTLSDDELQELFIDAIMPLLTQTPVLNILNRLQRTLDILDIEGLSLLWRLAHKTETEIGDGYEDPSLEEWSAFIDYYSSSPARSVHVVPDTGDLDRYLLAYLLSATFKDCSVMVRMDLLGSKGVDGDVIRQDSVKVIDLDPKSMARLRRWEKLDEEIVSAYVRVDETARKHCVDDGTLANDDEIQLKH